MTNNPALFNAAVAGSIGGTQQRWNTQTLAANFAGVVDAAAALASAIDANITPLAESRNSDNQLMQSIVQGIFANRFITSENTVDYVAIGESIAALWRQSRTVVQPVVNPLGPVTVLDFLDEADGNINTAINLALAYEDTTEVIFPPYDYEIDEAIVSERDGITLTFIPGAILNIKNGGSITINGNATTLQNPYFQFNEVVFGEALTLSGVDCVVNQPVFENLEDNGDLTCLVIQGDGCIVNRVKILSLAKSLAFGIYLEAADGTQVEGVTVSGVFVDVGAPSVSDGTKFYDALIYMHSHYSTVRDFYMPSTGGRSSFTNLIHIDAGRKNVLENIWAFLISEAKYGIHLENDSEFCEILGSVITGRNSGTYVADSAGIYCEGTNSACGHLKMFQTAVTGFEVGILIEGGGDCPTFIGVSVANCDEYGIIVDTDVGGGFPINNWSHVGCYYGDVTQLRDIHFKSGICYGISFTSCQIGINDGQVAFYVEPTFTELNGMVVMGSRIIGAAGGSNEYVIEPNVNTTNILFLNNRLSFVTALGTGVYEAKCIDIFDPTFSGLVIGTRDAAGTSNNHMTRVFTDIYTANFGNIAAGAIVNLSFNYPTVPSVTTGQIVATMSNTLGAFAKLGIIFQWYSDGAGFIGGSAYNPTAGTINSVAGGVRFCITVFG